LYRRIRRDLVVHRIGPGVELEVFWKVLRVGRGPALSLFIHDVELLRLDCFGPGAGHIHVAWGEPHGAGEDRLYLAEGSVEAQIDRCLFELQRNLSYYQQRCKDERVRNTEIDRERLAQLTPGIRDTMLAYQSRAEAVGPDR
jgi:hypothetical protein